MTLYIWAAIVTLVRLPNVVRNFFMFHAPPATFCRELF